MDIHIVSCRLLPIEPLLPNRIVTVSNGNVASSTMLRDMLTLDREEADEHILMNGAPGIVEHEHSSHNQADALNDVFGSAPASPTLIGHEHDQTDTHGRANRAPLLDPSDIPRLRSIHVTSGYREGIAVSKEKHMQEGFDEGYTLGAELGLRAGGCLGALEGMWRALLQDHRPTLSSGVDARDDARVRQRRAEVQELLAAAEGELNVQTLFGDQYFGQDGLWVYDIPGQESLEGGVTFEQVAGAHPLVKKWEGILSDLAVKLGLVLR